MTPSSYLQNETQPKPLTTGDQIAPGQIDLNKLSADLFLQIQATKLHNHEGVDSTTLRPAATPYMIQGLIPREREQHGTATWTGSANPSGNIVLTFGNEFLTTPLVIATAVSGNANIIIGIGSVSTTGVTIYFRDEAGTNHTSMPINWIAIGT